jgi:hypothetical protein
MDHTTKYKSTLKDLHFLLGVVTEAERLPHLRYFPGVEIYSGRKAVEPEAWVVILFVG